PLPTAVNGQFGSAHYTRCWACIQHRIFRPVRSWVQTASLRCAPPVQADALQAGASFLLATLKRNP
ncbi:MAG: hypothetical protein ABIK79_06125, partial [Chloroflexota bacterium]